MNCLFCNLDDEMISQDLEGLWVVKDRFPVTEGHRLIIPKRHVVTYLDLSLAEMQLINIALKQLAAELRQGDPSIAGFNIGMNCGEVAGQTVGHCHVHLIPRRAGDCEDPRGGVRGVISAKQRY